jgi:hypothetical protein
MPVQDNITNRLVRLENAFGEIFLKAMDWAEEDFRNEITTIKWDWPGATKRQNGSVAGTSRDIVDLGGLLASQRREDFGRERTVFQWTGKDRDGERKDYALYVHDGYVSKGGVRMPARPFTDNAIARLPQIVDSLIVAEIRNNG